MIKTRFIFAVSFCAMIAAGAVYADTATTGIAGVSYVDRAVGTATTAANNAQTSANNANAAAGNAQTSADNAQDAADAAQKSADEAAQSAASANTAVAKKQDKSTAAYQMGNASGGWTTMTTEQQNALNSGVTSAKVTTYDGYVATIAAKQTTANIVSDTSDYNDDIASTTKYPSMAVAQDMASQAAAGAVASKVNTAQGSSAANKAVITNGSGNITTGMITSGMITDGTIVNADISSSAAIAISKISGLQEALDAKQATLTIDSALSSTSTNPVQNKVINTALEGKQATISDLTTIRSGAAAGATAVQPDDLADVATSGSYNDLTNKPTIPSGALASKSTITNADVADDAAIAQSKISGLTSALSGKQATISDLTTIRSGAAAGATALQKADIATGSANGTISVDGTDVSVKGLGTAAYTASTAYATAAQGTLAASAVQPDDLAAVATSGKYSDLTGTPTIPTVNNATLKIQKNGTDVATFTANSSTGATANIVVPTGKLADLDAVTSAYITDGTIVNADISSSAAIATSKISGLDTALAAKQTTANIVSDTSDYNDDIASTTKYPSMAVAQDMASQAAAGAVASKVNTAQGSSAANKAVITNSSGNITTGMITSGMITDGTVATVDIADSAVTTAKIAASAVTSAKIADSNVTTAKIAAGAVTAAKTTGIYGYIPSGGEGSTTATATIWVE